MKDAEVIQVIRTRIMLRGKGEPGSPYRRIVQYWSLEGELLAEVDSFCESCGCPREGEG